MQHRDLLDAVSYDPDTGQFTNRSSGKVLGYTTGQGYVLVGVLCQRVRAHRLAWFYTHCEWPEGIIHHKDRDRANNRIDNLERSDNQRNNRSRSMQSNNKSGFTGVYPYRHKGVVRSWYYEINKGSRKIAHSSGFKTAEAAHKARQAILIPMGYASDHGVEPSKYTPSHKL